MSDTMTGHATARFKFGIGERVFRKHAQLDEGPWLVVERFFVQGMSRGTFMQYTCRALAVGKATVATLCEDELTTSTGATP